MGTRIAEERQTTRVSRSVPTTGMRGGLGRTLLTAFLILTILPLVLVVGYAVQQNRRNIQQEVESRLLSVATLKGEALQQWLNDLQTLLLVVVSLDDGALSGSRSAYAGWWTSLSEQLPSLVGVVIWGPDGRYASDAQPLWSTGAACVRVSDHFSPVNVDADSGYASVSPTGPVFFYPEGVVSLPIVYQNQTFFFCIAGAAAARVVTQVSDVAVSGYASETAYLTYQGCLWSEGLECAVMPIMALPTAAESGAYVNHEELPVIGAHYALPGSDVGVLIEQSQAETAESVELIAATLIALVLAVALVTTAISAVVIRHITRPVIRLTESALAMAGGELDQHLEVTSRDEIGILTYVFNEMAADLKSLYADLEAKVVERTQKLQKVNYQIQRRALHLQASQEVSQAITSVRDPQLLLTQLADLIRDSFMYASVAIYMVEPGGGAVALSALSPDGAPSGDGVGEKTSDGTPPPGGGAPPGGGEGIGGWPDYIYAGDGSVIERAIRKRKPQVYNQEIAHPEMGVEEVDWYRRTMSWIAVPLRMGERVIGAIAALSTEYEGIQADEQDVLELLANQVAIAVENARAYERERMATQHLADAEAFKARFLANMSHALREPLNTIIGFSRLMIKGVDGPLSEQQLQDMEQIYGDSQRLLFLINDILAISQIQAGLMELKLQPIHLSEVIAGVMPTASALVHGRDIALIKDIPDDLPLLRIDPTRIRQVLVHLLNNAAKFTDAGNITLRAWYRDERVYVSVSDTGGGIPPEDRERIFVRFNERGARQGGRQEPRGGRQESPEGAGLGLALSKEFVEMHGGQIWVQSKVGEGSTFTFSLPCYSDIDL